MEAGLLEAARTQQARPDPFGDAGQSFVVDFELTRAGRSATVRSIWFYRTGEDFPRLVSSFVR